MNKKGKKEKHKKKGGKSQLPVAHACTRGNPLRVTLLPVKTP
jgi:hypothetical protein